MQEELQSEKAKSEEHNAAAVQGKAREAELAKESEATKTDLETKLKQQV